MPKFQILVWQNLMKMTIPILAPELQEPCKFITSYDILFSGLNMLRLVLNFFIEIGQKATIKVF